MIEWISEKEAAELMGVSRKRMSQMRLGYKSRKNGKEYFNKPVMPAEIWRYDRQIEYDKNALINYKASKGGN